MSAAKPSLFARIIVLLKSSAVGLVATACDLGTTTLLVRVFDFTKQQANLPGLIPGLAVMFIGNKFFAFEDKSKKVVRQGVMFLVIELIALGLNVLFYHLIVTYLDWHEVLARAVGTNVTYLGFSFPMWNWLVFKLPQGQPAGATASAIALLDETRQDTALSGKPAAHLQEGTLSK